MNKDKHIARVEAQNLQLEEAAKQLNAKVEKQTYNDLLSKVGLSRSRISTSTPARPADPPAKRKSRSATPEKSPRNDQSKSRHSKKSVERINASYDKTSLDKYNLKSGLKEMVSDKLRSRRRDEERINRSIERSYERYRDHSFDKSKERPMVITQMQSPKRSPVTISRVVSQTTEQSQKTKKSGHGYHSEVEHHK